MDLVDTHCHIQSIGLTEGERTTREQWAKAPGLTAATVVAEAQAAGVRQMVCVGCDLADSRLAVEFVRQRAGCYASIGLHPHEAQPYAGKSAEQQGRLEEFAALAARPKVVAVGECGLDYYYEHSPQADQLAVLKFQIELALKHDLPLIFHVREAFDDFWPVFDSYRDAGAGRKLRGVLHSFTDSAANLAKALERGLYIGVNGIATFAKDEELLTTYQKVPLEKLLLETDAPFLTPIPYRGKINEPKQLGAIAGFLASMRREAPEDLAQATTRNAHTLFGIKETP